MAGSMKISDVSKSLGIPASTLRYWDKEGLIQFERDGDNNYRRFSFQTMLDICEIMLFRSLELPLPAIKSAEKANPDQLLTLLQATKIDLESKLRYYERVIAKIKKRQQKFEQFKQLETEPIREIIGRIPSIHAFDFRDQQMVQMYLDDPSLSADILRERSKNAFQCGLFIDDEHHQGKILRAGDKGDKPYLYGLLWMNRAEQSNADEFRKAAPYGRCRQAEIICKYLMSARAENGEYRNYFEAWMELDAVRSG